MAAVNDLPTAASCSTIRTRRIRVADPSDELMAELLGKLLYPFQISKKVVKDLLGKPW